MKLFGKKGILALVAGILSFGIGVFSINKLAAPSPEKTVTAYFQAVKSGNSSEAISYFTPEIRAQYNVGMGFADLLKGIGVSSDIVTAIIDGSNVKAYRNYEFKVTDTEYNEIKNFAKVFVEVKVNDIVAETTSIPCQKYGDLWYITNKSESYYNAEKCKMSASEEAQYNKLDIIEYAKNEGYSVHHIQNLSNNSLSFVLNGNSIVINDSNSWINLYSTEVKSWGFDMPYGTISFYDDKCAAYTVNGKWILSSVQKKQMCELLTGFKNKGVVGFCGNNSAEEFLSGDYEQLMKTYGLQAEYVKIDGCYLFYINNGTDRVARIGAQDHKSSDKAELLATWNDSTGKVDHGSLFKRENFEYDYVSSDNKLVSSPERIEQLRAFFSGSETVSNNTASSNNVSSTYENDSPVSINNKGQINCHGGTVAGYTGSYITESGPVGFVRNSLGNAWHVTAVKQFSNYGITWYELYDSDDGDYYGWVDGNYIDFY
ncbi:MAG: hypothetical protein IJ170_11140 [Ruminococcus sp.]|nr:hypothetical protein [Ruminococcus sp.]